MNCCLYGSAGKVIVAAKIHDWAAGKKKHPPSPLPPPPPLTDTASGATFFSPSPYTLILFFLRCADIKGRPQHRHTSFNCSQGCITFFFLPFHLLLFVAREMVLVDNKQGLVLLVMLAKVVTMALRPSSRPVLHGGKCNLLFGATFFFLPPLSFLLLLPALGLANSRPRFLSLSAPESSIDQFISPPQKRINHSFPARSYLFLSADTMQCK